MKIRLASEITRDSIVDGPGLRAVVWAQGCSHNCPGCHNPATHDFKGGFETDTMDVIEKLASLKLQKGVTLSGGDPFFQPEAMTEIAVAARAMGMNVWAYSGFTFEQLLDPGNPHYAARMELLKHVDVLVDGRFEISKRDTTRMFRGSSNQRLVDVQRSLALYRTQEVQGMNHPFSPVLYEPWTFTPVNERDRERFLPLHFAVERQNTRLLDFFLKRGADVNARDGSGRTAMDITDDPTMKEALQGALRGKDKVNLMPKYAILTAENSYLGTYEAETIEEAIERLTEDAGGVHENAGEENTSYKAIIRKEPEEIIAAVLGNKELLADLEGTQRGTKTEYEIHARDLPGDMEDVFDLPDDRLILTVDPAGKILSAEIIDFLGNQIEDVPAHELQNFIFPQTVDREMKKFAIIANSPQENSPGIYAGTVEAADKAEAVDKYAEGIVQGIKDFAERENRELTEDETRYIGRFRADPDVKEVIQRKDLKSLLSEVLSSPEYLSAGVVHIEMKEIGHLNYYSLSPDDLPESLKSVFDIASDRLYITTNSVENIVEATLSNSLDDAPLEKLGRDMLKGFEIPHRTEPKKIYDYPQKDKKTYLAVVYAGEGKNYIEYSSANDFLQRNEEIAYSEDGIYDCLDQEYFNEHPELRGDDFIDSPAKQKWIEEQLNDENLPDTLMRLQSTSSMWTFNVGRKITVLESTPKEVLEKFSSVELYRKNGALFISNPYLEGKEENPYWPVGYMGLDSNKAEHEYANSMFDHHVETEKDRWFDYAELGELEISNLEDMVEHGFPIDMEDSQGRTALRILTDNNCLEGVERLLELGADSRIGDKDGVVPAMAATWKPGQEDVLAALLDQGGQYIKDKMGRCAIDHLIAHPHKSSLKMFDILSKHWSAISSSTVENAFRHSDNPQLVKDLFKLAVDKEIIYPSPRYLHKLLMMAAENRNAAGPIMWDLIGYVKDRGHTEIIDMSPEEVYEKFPAYPQFATAEKPVVYGPAGDHDTPAFHAAKLGNGDTALCLLESGARADFIHPDTRRTLAHEAVLHGETPLLCHVTDKFPNSATIHDVDGATPMTEVGKVKGENIHYGVVVGTLIRSGAYVNDRDNNGRTATMYAALSGNDEALRSLAQYYPDLTIRDAVHRQNAMDFALNEKNAECVVSLAEAGARFTNLTQEQIEWLVTANEGPIQTLKPGRAEMGKVVGGELDGPAAGTIFILTKEGMIYNTKAERSDMASLGSLKYGEQVKITSYMNGGISVERLSAGQKKGPRDGGGIGGRG